MTPSPPAPYERVARRLRRWADRGVGPAVVVALSGGGDSVALLRMSAEAAATAAGGGGVPWRIVAAHVHHGARAEADGDAEFCRELARSLGVPFELARWSPTRTSHFEADARAARYRSLAEIARRLGANAILTAHTLDDQVETALHRVLRGTGLRGAAGMPAARTLRGDGSGGAPVRVLRPLLSITREELRAYLRGIGQPFREDESNADTSRARARIRHRLLPTLAREHNPRVVEALARLARAAREADRVLRGLARPIAGEALRAAGPDWIEIDPEPLRGLPRIVRAEVFRAVWRRQRWPEGRMTARHWDALARCANRARGPAFQVAGGIRVARDRRRGTLVLTRPGAIRDAGETDAED